jgi:putative DNA primase/helicase
VSWSNGARYFSPDYGLMVGRLADAVKAAGPLLVDTDGRFWVYGGGVWRLDPENKGSELRRRVVTLLGERYRPSHFRALVDVLGSHLESFLVGPVQPIINFTNGLLYWGADPDPSLIEHNAECLSTVQLAVPWDSGATCPKFDAFLASALPEDDIDRAWEVIGYLMMSGNPLQRMFLLSGGGGNGKGVFLNVLRALIGEVNFSAVELHELSDDKFASADLYGKLANICGDIDATYIEKTGKVKELSGDDKVRAQFKGKDAFKFLFWGKAIFSANAIPGTSDSSVGWTRRWEVLQFPYAPKKPDPNLSRRVTSDDELAGVAVKAVHALRRLMAEGKFSTGESRDKAHREFADKANKVRRWLDDPDSGVQRTEERVFNKGTILLKAFRQWEEHDSGGGVRTGVQRFNELCRQAGLEEGVIRGRAGFYGALVTGQFLIKPEEQPWMNRGRTDVGELHPSPPPAPPTLL